MNAEIIAVGTELLLGDTLNTNAQYLSKQLANHGISMFYQTVVGDNRERLLKAFEQAYSRADVVITSGGLGPTDDDMTKETAAEFFGVSLVTHEPSLARMSEYLLKQNYKLTENNKKQALILEGGQPLKNKQGTAPGVLFTQNGKTLIMLPGPPSELKPMFDLEVLPYFKAQISQMFLSKTLRICGVGESMVETMLKPIIDKQTNPTIAPYAKTSEVHLRVTAKAENEQIALEIMQPTVDEIYKVLGDNIYAEDDVTLAQTVYNLLRKNNLTIAIAESCTGGMLTSELASVSGVSETLLESVVAYSNGSKVKRLNVLQKTLDKFGAVSVETAEEMAQGIAKTSGANVGVSTTGIAGPNGATDDKPLGLVYISVHINGETATHKLNVLGDRQRVRTRATVNALDFLRRALLKV